MNVSASPRPLRCTIQFVMKSPMLRPTLYIPVEKFNNMNDYVRIVQNAPCQNVLTLSQNSTREPAYDICPTDFSIELSLTGVFDDLMIEMIKITAKRTRTFPVGPYLANLIYTKDLLPLDRINFNSSSGLPLTIRPISFNSSEKSSMDQVFFYSGDIFMGSLLSLQMSNSTLSAMNLALVTPLYYVAWHWPDFAVMVSQLPGFLGTNSYQSIPVNSEGTTQVQNFTAGNYYIIDQDYSAENSNTLTNFTFDSNNTKLTIYAGCVVNPFEGLKVVTITNDTVKNFTRVVVKSTCRTYVVEQGTVSMATTFDNLFYGLSSPAINGTIGAIMTSLMPTQAENNSFWIKASDGSKITVSYDFPLFNNASTDGLTFKVDDGSTQNLM
ncbi:unnamed protein product [Caenorhabditis auriculariae]|uniref:Uncharacterized protein n=1 Tax=Caenorhabditis auriculariae TaxID=2777116 RepID=A0A8S1GS73_9PELO|nr:unnamed protein product [Caenorhabditis auriculariae]